MNHFFNTGIAKKYGIKEAILFENLVHWVKLNKANRRNFVNGKYWTYNSVKAFQEVFDYMSAREISNALNRLEAKGLIESGCFNDNRYDRTKWYTISDFGYKEIKETLNLPISQKGEMENAEKKNEFDKDAESNEQEATNDITYINTDINTDINSYTSSVSDGHDREEQNLKTKKRNVKERKPVDEEAKSLAQLLLDLHREIDPKFTTRTLDKWAEDIEKIHRLDNRTYNEIRTVIYWAKRDDFWKTNIMSGKKLREKFPMLYAKMTAVPSGYQKKPLTNEIDQSKQKYYANEDGSIPF